ncbi:methylglutamate dehydrogenase [Sulfuriferula thiophila]|uniref:methylglutamate dehydrogenase n=1 Tax=Sulfuriferula thiophila TaxID=1781211 RepID=UPI000F60A7B4|nr:methylglutamate dehydrogenase [Sulfuriferula thiophila]
MNALRKSPFHDVIATLQPEWGMYNDMPTALQFDIGDSQRMQLLGIADVSCLWRCGLKGPHSKAWLETHGIAVPAVNSWEPLSGGSLIARLGNSEFLFEDGLDGATAQHIQAMLTDGPHGVYPVLRQDAALILTGAAVQQLLRQTCSFNFMTLDKANRPLVLTTMVGVPVTVLPVDMPEGEYYRVWCDGTYGEYLWRTLLDIACELGGGAVGLNSISIN